MRQLNRFLMVPFDDDGISLDELLNFTTDNVQRMTVQNPVVLATRIAATTAKLNILVTCSGSDTVKLGVRKAAKQAKDTWRKNLKDPINTIWLAVAGKYGMNAPQVLEVFPQGRTSFASQETSDDGLMAKLDALVAAVTVKAADLGATIVTLAESLKTQWTQLYQDSEAASGQKALTESGKRAAREDLQLELYFNLIELMKMFPRQPEKLTLYMTQSLLEDPASTPTPPPAPPGP